jgi:glycosyltransferase involved in cell wall biosynthesis
MDAEQLTTTIAESYRRLLEFGYDFSNGLLFAWLSSGPIVQLEYDLETDKGADDWTFWWISWGRQNYPGISNEVDLNILQALHLNHLRTVTPLESLPLTPLLSLVYRHRNDLQQPIDIKAAGGVDQLWRWWLSSGRNAFFGSEKWLITAEVQAIHRLDVSDFRKTGIPKPTALVMLAAANSKSLQRKSHTGDAAEIASLWATFLSSEAKMFDLPNRGFPFIPISESPEASDKSTQNLLPPGLAIIAMSRPDLQAVFGRGKDGASDFVYWWITSGREEFPDLREEIDRSLLHSLHIDHLPRDDIKRELALTPLLIIVRDRRPDLQRLFEGTDNGTPKLWRWWFDNGRAELFGQLDRLIDPELHPLHQLETRALEQSTEGLTEIYPVASRSNSNGPSVCLVGYPRGEFGLGEDVRLLRAALDQAKITNVVINAPWPISARQSIDEPSVDASIANFDCDVMFYVMPPFDTVTLLTKMGVSAFSARRKIGFWQWELDRFPVQAKLAMHLVDEIWCHSEHTAKAFRAATDKPVVKVPLPVFVPEPRLVPRTFFGLPTDAFVVFTSFDGASSIARKNPLAAILSFEQAFPRGGIDARLIVKAMNTQNDSLWRECLRKASIDQRIVVIDDVMDRSAYFELLRNCDAVLSLHRAEGFGRLMAEAMALGIPVIASRYSGNLDYMTDENSWLIDGELIALFPGDYAFHQHQEWFEPSIAEAARALRECAADPRDRRRRATLGMNVVVEKYNLVTCGNTYSNLLNRNPVAGQTSSA